MFDIKTTARSFQCPITDLKVKKGDAYLQDEYGRYHISLLPARRLRLIRRRQKINTAKQ